MSSRLTLVFRFVSYSFLLSFALTQPGSAQGLSALAQLDGANSGAAARGDNLVVDLSLSQAVPYRVFTLDAPRRLVADFREVDWRALQRSAFEAEGQISDLRAGLYRPGWSRLVLELSEPMGLESAGMKTDAVTGRALVSLVLSPRTPEEFAARAGAPDSEIWGLPKVARLVPTIRRQEGDRPLVVVLDPGHGGIDPGAQRDGDSEAGIMLQFARTLKDALLRAGGFEVVLTRDDDSFVSLETRVSIARSARADVFLSFHADALSEGQATGAAVFTLSDTASDAASARLAERHDRADLLAGVDLSDQDDVIATVLMELARLETAPRSDRLADALVASLREGDRRLYKRPRQTAGFSVLKAPDIPSALIEIGYLSSSRDLADLRSDNWRARTAAIIVSALRVWAAEDAAEARLIRR